VDNSGHCRRSAVEFEHVGERSWTGSSAAGTITGLGLGCGSDNRLAYETGWTNSIGADGRIHWHPPPLLDTGQPTVNYFHHPEELLTPTEDEGRQQGSPA